MGILLIFHTYIFGENVLLPQSWLSSYAYVLLNNDYLS